MEFSMDYKKLSLKKLVTYREDEEESTCLKFSVTIVKERCLKTTSTQCTRERKPTAEDGGNTINTNATTEVPAAAGVHTTAAAEADHAAADHAAAAYTAAAITTTAGGSFFFKHPFTATISGPTSCGKTHFCKVILQHCLTMIWPPPERILWLYKRWQPLYDVIQEYSLSQRRIHSRNTFRSRSRFLYSS